MQDTIHAEGRANPCVTETLAKLGKLAKGLLAIAAAVSVCEMVTAGAWSKEFGSQIAPWSGAIVAGSIGSGVSAILGPMGAVVGGITGGIIGSVAGEGACSDLASWFYSGTSGLSAVELLRGSLEDARKQAKKCTQRTGQNYQVHQPISADLKTITCGAPSASTLERIMNTPSIPRGTADAGVEVRI
jgi:hypothetical protein